jgi:hypothetical protein
MAGMDVVLDPIWTIELGRDGECAPLARVRRLTPELSASPG